MASFILGPGPRRPLITGWGRTVIVVLMWIVAFEMAAALAIYTVPPVTRYWEKHVSVLPHGGVTKSVNP